MALPRDTFDCPLLISYPHSGNSWARYAVETATKQPTLDAYDGRIIRPDYVDMEAHCVLVKYHNMDALTEDDRRRKLIVLIRDPRECIGSRLHRGADRGQEGYIRDEAKRYVKLLSDAAAWPSPALVLHYEDIILRPRISLTKLFSSLGVPVSDKAAESFFSNLNGHFDRSRSSFIMGSISTAGSIHWHAKRLGEERLEAIARAVSTAIATAASNSLCQMLARYGFNGPGDATTGVRQ